MSTWPIRPRQRGHLTGATLTCEAPTAACRHRTRRPLRRGASANREVAWPAGRQGDHWRARRRRGIVPRVTDGVLILPDETHAPRLTASEARDVLAEHWGRPDAQVTELGSYQDQVFQVDLPGGERFALKLANTEVDRAVLEAEHAVLHRLAGQLGPLANPVPVPTTSGEEIVRIGGHLTRVLSWVPGARSRSAGSSTAPVRTRSARPPGGSAPRSRGSTIRARTGRSSGMCVRPRASPSSRASTSPMRSG